LRYTFLLLNGKESFLIPPKIRKKLLPTFQLNTSETFTLMMMVETSAKVLILSCIRDPLFSIYAEAN